MPDEQEYSLKSRIDGRLRLLESIVGNASDAILVTEAEHIDKPGPRIVFVNESFTRTTGYTFQEIIGRTPRILQGKKTDRTQLDEIRSALSKDESVRVELLNYRKDGSEFWVEINIVPIADELGQTTHYVSIQREITERKHTEQELQRTSRELTTIFESITDAFFSLDREWRFTYLNSEAERVLERERDALLGKSVWEEFPEAVGLKFYEEYNRAVNERRTVEFEEIYPSLETWFEVKAYPSEAGLSVYFRDINERKTVERELKESEERLRTILVQYASDTITILEADGTIRYESPAIERMLGYRPDELVGENIIDYVHPEDVSRAIAELATVRSSSEVRESIEVRFRRKDGSWRWIEGIANNLIDDSNVGGIVVNSRDITARKQAERRIAETEERYRTLVEQMPAIIYIYEPTLTHQSTNQPTTYDYEISYISPQVEKVLGYKPQELVRNEALWNEILHPDDRAEVLAEDERTDGSGDPFLMEYRMVCRDGRVVWIREEAILIRSPEGEPLYWQGVMIDVTERKLAEENLREAEALFRSAFDDVAVGMALTDPESQRYLRVNQAWCNMLGYSEEDLLTTTFPELTHPEDLEVTIEYARRAVAREIDSYQHEKRYICADGRIVWALTSVSVVRDTQDHSLYFVAQMQDITERKWAEEELRRNESSLAAAQRMAHVGNWEWVIGGGLYWSNELYRIYGFTPQQFVPTYGDFIEAIHPDDRDYVERAQEEVRRSGKQITIECRIVRTDGQVRILQNSFEMDYGETGNLTRIAGTVQDITGRKWEERRQRVQHGVTRTLAEASTLEDAAPEILRIICEGLKWEVGGFWSVDREAGMLRCIQTWNNPTVDNISRFVKVTHQTTLSKGEGLPGRIWESGEPVWLPDVWEARNFPRTPVAVKEGLHGGFGVPILLDERVLGVIDFFSREVRQPDEEVLEVMAATGSQIGQFIQRKSFEKELKEQREFLREIIDTDPNLVFVKDWHGRFTLANQAVADIYGATVDELVGKSDADFNANKEEVESFLQAEKEVLETLGKKFIPEERVTDARTDTAHWFQTVKVPLESSGNEPRRILGVSTDITERKILEKRLEYQAFHDSLTGLPNRALFTNRLRHALAGVRRRGGRVALLFLDLDNFKTINDSLGHGMGDRLLASVAERLKKCLRPGDTVARFSGDEFTLLLEDITGIDEAKCVAERILEELQPSIDLNGQKVYATASIGLAFSSSATQQTEDLLAEDLLRRADMAMYKAKRAGKAHYEVFDRSLEAPALKRHLLGYELRRALDKGEFRVYYQPVVGLETSLQGYLKISGSRAIVAPQSSQDTSSSRIIGMEALLRWEHPERGLLLPDEFIPIAEESGLIIQIGQWVFEQACHQLHTWQKQYLGNTPLLMSVNFSAKQFQGDGVSENIARVLQETDVDPAGLALEITENTVMEDGQAAIDTLHELKALGVKLIVDDFGVGYSSLAYLKKFPVDCLKIDHSFTKELIEDPGNQEVVKAVISLAHALNMKVVGEGIESAGQCAQLRALGCEMGQGNYFSEPVPAEAAGALLAKDPHW